MILSMKFASQFAVVCPMCGEWNSTEILREKDSITSKHYICQCERCKQRWKERV